MSERHGPRMCIVPPHIFLKLLDSRDRTLREVALNALLTSTKFRSQRRLLAAMPGGTNAGEKRRTIYDAKNLEPEPPAGKLVRGEGDPTSTDASVNEAYDGRGATYDFFKDVFSRNSLDGSGMRLDAIVHYGENFTRKAWSAFLIYCQKREPGTTC
jgi:Zn-dependent metalloprotease